MGMHITDLWKSSSTLLSSISPGIRLNPHGLVGLDNYCIKTSGFFGVWTSGNLKAASINCGQEIEHANVKNAFHIALSRPNFWTINCNETQAWTLSVHIKHIKYIGKLKSDLIAT
jgi:hypothetical protein